MNDDATVCCVGKFYFWKQNEVDKLKNDFPSDVNSINRGTQNVDSWNRLNSQHCHFHLRWLWDMMVLSLLI